MNAKQLERAAYLAAHRILMANPTAPELACPGAQRSRVIDTIATIIKEVYELGDASLGQRPDVSEHTAEFALNLVEPRRNGTLFDFPRRASS
jgi:hypothetical protein